MHRLREKVPDSGSDSERVLLLLGSSGSYRRSVACQTALYRYTPGLPRTQRHTQQSHHAKKHQHRKHKHSLRSTKARAMGIVVAPDVSDSARSLAIVAAPGDVGQDVVDLQTSHRVDISELGKEPHVGR